MQLGEAERALGNARAQPLHGRAHAAADRAEVFAPVVLAPHLEPVDHQLEARQRAREAAASSEKYGNAAVSSTS